MLDVCKDFARNTSVKGLPRIVKSNDGLLRCLWIFSFILFLSICIMHCSFLLIEYLEYPTVSILRELNVLQQFEKGKLEFPNLVLCKLNPYPNSFHSHHGIDNIESYMTYKAKVDAKLACYNCTQEEKIQRANLRKELLAPVGYGTRLGEDLGLQGFSHLIDDLLVSCFLQVYEGTSARPYPCQDVGVTVQNVPHAAFQSCSIMKFPKPNNTFYYHGATLVLYLDNFNGQTSFDPGSVVAQTSGAAVLVMEPDTYPVANQNWNVLQPGALTDVLFQFIQAKRLPPPYGTCTENIGVKNIDVLDFSYRYSFDMCVSTCMGEFVATLCGCCDPETRATLDYPDLPYCQSILEPIEKLLNFSKCMSEGRYHSVKQNYLSYYYLFQLGQEPESCFGFGLYKLTGSKIKLNF